MSKIYVPIQPQPTVFDNTGTPAYAEIADMWATLSMEIWRNGPIIISNIEAVKHDGKWQWGVVYELVAGKDKQLKPNNGRKARYYEK